MGAGERPRVSVIMAAWQAEATVQAALASLRAQHMTDWEAIVVDDGSTDGTVAVVQREVDARIHLLRCEHAGAAAARNAGLTRASADWLLFLDADDTLLPNALGRMCEKLDEAPDVDALCCGWTRVGPDGAVMPAEYPEFFGEPFAAFSRYCATVIHGCMVRRATVLKAGAFDPSFAVCEDWDLWLRLARAGARWATLREPLVEYRLRAGSLTTRVRPLWNAARRVLTSAHAADPRVRIPLPAYAAGMPLSELTTSMLRWVCWPAGLMLASGEDPVALLDDVARAAAQVIDAEDVAITLHAAMLVASMGHGERLLQHWAAIRSSTQSFVDALEARVPSPGLTRRTLSYLDRAMLRAAPADATLTAGCTHVRPLEITAPIPSLAIPNADVLLLHCFADGEALGTLELPVVDGSVAAQVIADAIAERFAWVLLGRFFARGVYRELRFRREQGGYTASRGGVQLTAGLEREATTIGSELHDAIGWQVLLQELWGLPRARMDAFYNEDEPGARWYSLTGPSVHAPASGVVIEAGRKLPSLRGDGERVLVELWIGGTPVTCLWIPLREGRVSPRRLRVALTSAAGFQLCRVAVREALVGRSLGADIPLRVRLWRAARAQRLPAAPLMPARLRMSPGAGRAAAQLAVPGAATLVLGGTPGSGCGRVRLPSSNAELLSRAWQGAGEPVASLQPARAGRQVVVSAPEVMAAPVRRPRPPLTQAGSDHDMWLTTVLPILRYAGLAGARTAPAAGEVSLAAFGEQMAHLRQAGYRTVTLGEWQEATAAHRPLRGRCVALTFDGAERSFAEHAWPVLRRHGLHATVFVPAALIRETSAHDDGRLDWRSIRRLHDEGVQFGAHAANGISLLGMRADEAVHEAVTSRLLLEQALGERVSVFAYLVAAADGVMRHIVSGCGFRIAVARGDRRSQRTDDRLALPRIDVGASTTLPDFVRALEG